MDTPVILHNVKIYVETLYNASQHNELLYHNLRHTQKVVQRCHEISGAYTISDTDLFVLIVAAWFHDAGQLSGASLNHEARSVTVMRDYLEGIITDNKIIDLITGCILATTIPHNPSTLLQEILCDADTYNLGTKEFLYTDSQIKREYELRNHTSSVDWDKNVLSFLLKHKYFTSYCQALLKEGKQKNIEIVIKRIRDNS